MAVHLYPHLHAQCDRAGCDEIVETNAGTLADFNRRLRGLGWRLRGRSPWGIGSPPDEMVWEWFCQRHATEEE